ncbi:MAG: hypothetical protein HY277_09535 [Ignavibacteriales bacterium]|nr:hypothetical protein [Ignavibacteriales bacterium]
MFNKQTGDIATGLLLDIHVAKLVLTVAHIFEGADPADLLVSLGISSQSYTMKKEKVWQDLALDLAYIQLNPFETTIFQGDGVKFFQPHKGTPLNAPHKPFRCAICGFPSKMASYKKSDNIIEASTCLVTSPPPLPYEQLPPGIEATPENPNGKNPKVNFLLKHGPKQSTFTLNDHQAPTSPVDPRGLSGAGIWIFNPESENDDAPEYSLFGIQTSFYHTHDLLVSTAVEPLMKQIEQDYRVSFSN